MIKKSIRSIYQQGQNKVSTRRRPMVGNRKLKRIKKTKGAPWKRGGSGSLGRV